VFPNGKRYVGCTKACIKKRWDGGLGYENQSLVFGAILKYGWNNIRHYILMDGLSKDEALLYEAAFIYSWKTYTKSRGYNTILPNIAEAKEINIPTFQKCVKVKIEDERGPDTEEIYRCRVERRHGGRVRKAVRCVDTGLVYKSAQAVVDECLDGIWDRVQVYNAIKSGKPCGEVIGYDEVDKCPYSIHLHWEYVN